MSMDPLAAKILSHCSTRAFRTLGALTRSSSGLARTAAVPSPMKRGATIYPYLCGFQDSRYYLRSSSSFLVDLAGREKQARFFQREPRVILERTISGEQFCAAYLEDRMAVGREYMVITSRSMHVDAMYLLGLLGSSLYAFLYLNYFRISYAGEKKKITLADVRKLPIPIDRPVERGLIIGLVMQVLNARAASPEADTSGLERQIDELVYRMFGIGPEEAAQLEGHQERQQRLFEELRRGPATLTGETEGARQVEEEAEE